MTASHLARARTSATSSGASSPNSEYARFTTESSSTSLTSTYGLTPARCNVDSRAGEAEPRIRGTRTETMRAGYRSRLPPWHRYLLGGSGAQDGLAQCVEADPADVERAAVKGLDVKGIALAGLDLLA